jgi:uncharacterized RDD family membrane protein YckC
MAELPTIPTTRVEIAPPLLRIFAFLVDGLIVAPVNLLIGLLLIKDFDPTLVFKDPQNRQLFDFFLIGSVTQAIYAVSFVSLIQATPGKLLFRMRIVRADGEHLLPDTAILRYLVVFVGNLLYEIEFIVSLFLMFNDPARRTIHDRVARTLVVRVRKAVARPGEEAPDAEANGRPPAR